MNPRPLSAVVVLCLAAGCSEVDPVGHYQTDPASFVAAFEATLPQDDPAAAAIRARFEAMKPQAASWQIALDLRADQSFTLTMSLPLVPTGSRRSGRWRRDGSTIELTTTHDGERLLPQPEVREAALEGSTIHFQDGPGTPRFVLDKTS